VTPAILALRRPMLPPQLFSASDSRIISWPEKVERIDVDSEQYSPTCELSHTWLAGTLYLVA